MNSEPQPTLAPGTQIGPYRIDAHLGKGGMGTVYRAVDSKLNRPVAIKFLSNQVADPDARRRFQREAQLASSLNHPHILTVHDAGEFESREYLVTEFVDGGTLKDWAEAEKRTWRQIIEMLTGVADGMAAAHQAGILHRDIKPANILVTRNGYAKLADFGLAKLEERPPSGDTVTMSEGETRPGVMLGTIAYMSPEQASSRPLDSRSDIFSFGVILYEMLSGRHPFRGGGDLQTLRSIVEGIAEPLSDDIPPAVRGIVEKALEKDPAERYQSVRELVVDLRRATRQKPVEPGSVTPPKHRATWWPWAAAGLLLLTGIGLGWLARGNQEPVGNPLLNATFTRLTDFEQDERDAAISPDGKWVVFTSDRDGTFDIFVTQIGTHRFANLTKGRELNLASALKAVGFAGDGSELWIHNADPSTPLQLLPLMGGDSRVFLAKGPIKMPPQNAAWSPDGASLVYHTSDDGDPMYIAERTGANPRQILIDKPGIHNHHPAWSQDGKWIYYSRGVPATGVFDLWRIRAAGGEPERLTQHAGYVGYPTSIDPQTVIYVARDRDGAGPWLWALDVAAKVTRRVSFGLEQYWSVAASADGRRLVASVATPTASLSSLPILSGVVTETEVERVALPAARALLPRYGGASLFYLSSRGTGDGLWRFKDGQAIELWRASDGVLLEPPAPSQDGRYVAFVLRKEGKLRLHTLSAEGGDLQALGGSLEVQGAASWSPDGKWIVTGGSDAEGAGVFKVPVDGGSPVRLAKEAGLHPVWSPSGDLIVYQGPNSGLYAPLVGVRPDGTRVELPKIQLHREGERVRFLPGGKALVYMQGFVKAQNFWLLELDGMKTRQLTKLSNQAPMRTFDITPDGKRIVFDRLRENSDIALIDLPRKP